jgi:endonuclease III
MHRLTVISSLLLAAIAVFSLSSCNKLKIPDDVAGLADSLKGATASLQGIADADAGAAVDKAKEALPDLEGVGAQLTNVQGLMENLPAPAKAVVTKAIESFGPQIEELIAKVTAIPGVGGAIQPALDKITAGLTALKG